MVFSVVITEDVVEQWTVKPLGLLLSNSRGKSTRKNCYDDRRTPMEEDGAISQSSPVDTGL